MAARKAGSPAGAGRFWTITVSDLSSGNARATTFSAFPDSPFPFWESAIVFIPVALPTASATRTNASQPQIAVLRWAADQRPARAARFILCPPVSRFRIARQRIALRRPPLATEYRRRRFGFPYCAPLAAE